MQSRIRDRRNVFAFEGEAHAFFSKAGGWSNISQRPEHQRKVEHGNDSDIVAETRG
jgi:hypothetical protein